MGDPEPSAVQERTELQSRPPDVLPAPSGAPPARLTFSSSDTISQFVTALAKAQLAFGQIDRALTAHVESKRTGAKYTYDYADLATVLAAVRRALNENDIAILQPPCVGQRSVTVTTLLAHGSGEWIRNDLTVGIDGTDPQAIGSAITYARRYGLMSLLGVAPEDDDDGAAAQPKTNGGRVVPMPERASASAPPAAVLPPSPGAPLREAPSIPNGGASGSRETAPVHAHAGAARALPTILKLEKRTATTGNPYWLVELTDGRKGMTFNRNIGDVLHDFEQRHVPIVDFVTHVRSDRTGRNWNEIDELVGGAR